MAAGAWFGLQEFNERLIFIKETDARVGAPMITVSSRVDGWLSEISVKEGQRVEAADAITKMDPRHVGLELKQLNVQLRSIAAERDRLFSERHMVAEQMRTQLDSRTSRVDAANAVVDKYVAGHAGIVMTMPLPMPETKSIPRFAWHAKDARWINLKCDLRAFEWILLHEGSVPMPRISSCRYL